MKSQSHRRRTIGEVELRWAASNLPIMRRWLAGQGFLYTWLAIAFALGLAAHVAGYLIARSGLGEPVGLLADLLANLGVALWTGGVLVVFAQILPEAHRRSTARLLEDYEAALRERPRQPDVDGMTTDGRPDEDRR